VTTTTVPTRAVPDARIRRLSPRLLAGALTGPAFVALSFAQVPFRDGFDLSRHPYSFLLNGPGGALQAANFVLLGSGFLVTATALRSVLAGRPGRLAAVLAAGIGIGQIAAGLFAPGGAYGYPAGAPSGRPEHLSAGSIVHGIAFGASMLSWVALLVVLALALRREHRRAALLSVVTAAVLLVVAGVSGREDGAAFIYCLATPAFIATSAVLAHLYRLARSGRIAR
jgi:hypothetical protein